MFHSAIPGQAVRTKAHVFSLRTQLRRLLWLAAMLTAAAVALGLPGSGANAAPAKPRIALIGSGQVGGTLGTLWAKAGYPVMFSSRHPEELTDLVAEAGPNARAGSVEQAIAFADVVVLAVPYGAEPSLAKQYGAALRGKILIDADNAYPGRDGEVARAAQAEGVARYSSRLFAGTRFVRAFNSVNASSLRGGGGGRVQVLYSTRDAQAAQVAEELIRATGSVPVRGDEL